MGSLKGLSTSTRTTILMLMSQEDDPSQAGGSSEVGDATQSNISINIDES